MADHIILTAFGTTFDPDDTYTHLEKRIRSRFPHAGLHRAYSSSRIRAKILHATGPFIPSVDEVLTTIKPNAGDRVVIQSLHIAPGKEFHRVVAGLKSCLCHCRIAIGLPLLSLPADFNSVAATLAPLINSFPESGIIVVGHGTSHPSWVVYPALETFLRRKSGPRIFVVGLKEDGNRDSIIDDLADGGCRHVLLIPFLLVAGMHFRRDITGPGSTTWASRLDARGIDFTCFAHGLGIFDSIADIFCDHIDNGFQTLQAERDQS